MSTSTNQQQQENRRKRGEEERMDGEREREKGGWVIHNNMVQSRPVSSFVACSAADTRHGQVMHWWLQKGSLTALPPFCRLATSSDVKVDAEMDLTRWLNSRLKMNINGYETEG